MSNLCLLTPGDINAGVVEMLADALADAKAGKLSAVAIAYVARDGGAGSGFTDLPNRQTMLGELLMLQHKIAAEIGRG